VTITDERPALAHTYIALYDITDKHRPLGALIAEACAGLDAMAANDGARIVGDPHWQVCGDRLVGECPAVPLTDTHYGEVDPREYVDEVAVERALRGARQRLTAAEMRAAVARLARMGKSASEISRGLHASYATVTNYLRDAA